MAKRGGYTVLQEFESSSSGTIHEVRLGGDSVIYCTCPAWKFNKEDPKTCKHIAESGFTPGKQTGIPHRPIIQPAAQGWSPMPAARSASRDELKEWGA